MEEEPGWFMVSLTEVAAFVARRNESTTRASSSSERLLKKGSRTSRPLTSLVTGHSTGRAEKRRPPSESWSGT